MAATTLVLLVTYSLFLLHVSTQRLEFQFRNQTNFNFTNCNRSAVPFYVTSLELHPDPVQLGELIVLGAAFVIEKDIGDNSRVEVELNLRLKTSKGYTELCEILGADKCHYNDLCEKLKTLMKRNTCPDFMKEKYHNNCSCPFLKGEYNIGRVPLFLPGLPFQLRGAFDITVNLQEKGTHIGCINLQFCITNCKPLSG
ncbi:ganglioside GM2 activator-like isoform X2 [Mercenaria mercenaria]|uniref:ganglioside GM2 activator-like isoform X2 n=1 Tax=Mercenaria mercenaria TaxID=6596 RepID=UPI00234FAD05|nr:ganglioside GM2 activator-like isoform X2 [Mercenaria mercenaria]